ncbi:hypothetical protein M407DRAFT_27323 [Tulasnella calospora MUT 4182]|uniref:Uncharacterized protein n=1 Tax=Tulasnella calospora MUT 4182 TaxID=1051891 RepID=A0A0C3LP19_9AGAM|nr:hypothetical protein M407DRAFT_27323 [Tulasnella calospora MUT 4182]
MEEAPAAPPSSAGVESQQDSPPTIATDSLPEGKFRNSEEVTSNTLTTNHSSSSRDTTVNLTSPLHNDEIKQAPSFVPYALKWTEHEMELRPVKPLTSSKPPGMTSNVFPRLEHSCTAVPNSAGEFIIFGGKVKPEKEEVMTNDVILLSTTDMSFTGLETNGAKPKVKSGHRAVIAGRVLVIFGGSNGDSYLHFLNLDTREWSNLRPPAPYPGPRFGHSFIIVNNTIWLFGGGLVGDKMDDLWCIDLGTDGIEYVRWRRIPKKDPWPEARSYHTTVCYDGCLYIFAGQGIKDGEQKSHRNDIWKFDIPNETWTKLQCDGQLPQPRTSHTATVMGDNMFVFGGVIQGSKEGEFVRTDHAFVFNFQGIWSSASRS